MVKKWCIKRYNFSSEDLNDISDQLRLLTYIDPSPKDRTIQPLDTSDLVGSIKAFLVKTRKGVNRNEAYLQMVSGVSLS
jgi:hypothetical protein